MRDNRQVLKSSDRPLREVYDVAVLDLDGVVYVGPDAVPGAPAHLNEAIKAGMRLAFVTNNAARPPAQVGDHLRRLGVEAADEDVVTSAQAAAGLLAQRLPGGSRVYLIGGEGLRLALIERGLEPVTELDGASAVAQGYGPDMPWRQVVRGALLVARGVPWVASNTDMSIPTAEGIGPGNGALVRLVGDFAGRTPEVAGKPETPLYEETLRRVGGERPLVVGDRLDTDIAGAKALGWDSLLVLTGVTGVEELVRARPEERPTYLASDLSALADPQPALDPREPGVGGWRASVEQGRVRMEGGGSIGDWWRTLAVAAWSALDETGQPVATADLAPPS